MSDGSYTAVTYGSPVHYMDGDGAWQEIDNRLTVDTRTGVARAEKTGVSFARATPSVAVQHEGYTLAWSMEGKGVSTGLATVAQSVSEFLGTSRQVTNMSETSNYKSLSADDKKMSAEKAFSKVTYEKQADGYQVQYTVAPGRIKEDIVLSSAKTTVFTVNFEENGLSARLSSGRSVIFCDEEDNTVMTVCVPYMIDANGEESTDISLSLYEQEAGYQLVIRPDYEWLTDASRAYPVIIDTEYVYGDSDAENDIIDTMVHEGDSATSCSCGLNHRTHTMMRVGKKDGIQYRSYLKFDFESEYAMSKLNSAKINLHLWSSTSTGGPFSIYRVTGSWNQSTLTYATQPSNVLLKKNVPYVTNSDGSKTVTFDITSGLELMFAGGCPDYGFMISYTNTSTNDSNSFYTVDYSTVAYRPQLTLNYNEFVVADESTHRVNNVGNHKFLMANNSSLSASVFYDEENYSNLIEEGTEWKFYRLDSYHGYCAIKSHNGKALRDTGSAVGLYTLPSGTQNTLSSMPANCQWNIFKIGDQYTIKNKATGRYLRLNGTTVTASTDNSGTAGRWYVGYTPCTSISVRNIKVGTGQIIAYNCLDIKLNVGGDLPSLPTDKAIYTIQASPAGAVDISTEGIAVRNNFEGTLTITVGRLDTMATATFTITVYKRVAFYLTNILANKCLCFDYRNATDDANVGVYGNYKHTCQQWVVERIPNSSYYTIRSVYNGYYLALPDNTNYSAGTEVKIRNFSGSVPAIGQWRITYSGTRGVKIAPRGNSAVFLMTEGNGTSDSTKVVLGTNNNFLSQHWQLESSNAEMVRYNLNEQINNQYDRETAVEYAMNYANSPNTEQYTYKEGHDCANFVSQCLFAGGLNMIGTPTVAGECTDERQGDTANWFYRDFAGVVSNETSLSWSNAEGFRQHWGWSQTRAIMRSYQYIQYDSCEDIIRDKEYLLTVVQPGDVIQQLKLEDENVAQHTMIVYAVTDDNIYYAQHSGNGPTAFYNSDTGEIPEDADTKSVFGENGFTNRANNSIDFCFMLIEKEG